MADFDDEKLMRIINEGGLSLIDIGRLLDASTAEGNPIKKEFQQLEENQAIQQIIKDEIERRLIIKAAFLDKIENAEWWLNEERQKEAFYQKQMQQAQEEQQEYTIIPESPDRAAPFLYTLMESIFETTLSPAAKSELIKQMASNQVSHHELETALSLCSRQHELRDFIKNLESAPHEMIKCLMHVAKVVDKIPVHDVLHSLSELLKENHPQEDHKHSFRR